jgi:hypothetical protein
MATFDPNSQVIDPRLLDPYEIRAVLEAYVAAQPDKKNWKDFYSTGAGATLIELISGLGSFVAYSNSVARRESTLNEARLSSSVREHAFNRGILGNPTNTLELTLTLSLTGSSATFTRKQVIGTLGTYNLYSLETKSVTSGPFTLKVAVGHLETFTQAIAPKRFQTYEFELPDTFLANHMEELKIDGTEVTLVSELNFLEKYQDDFMLRHLTPKTAKIYVGNGVLGWYNEAATSLEYTVLSYGEDLVSERNAEPNIATSGVSLDSYIVSQEPVYGIDKEELRGLAVYYPLDGRIVQDKDYDAVILKYFGGVLHDVFSYNSDPNQVIVMLVDDNYVGATHLPPIQNLVDSKRGAGINVTYEILDKTDGKVLNLDLRVTDYDFYLSTRENVLAFLEAKRMRFNRVSGSLSARDIAVELTEEFGLKFYVNTDETITLEPFDFIKSFNLTVNA